MDKKKPKLSPLDFLNQLKAGGKSSNHLPQRTTPPSELNLDFSDLAAPAESAPQAEAVAAAHPGGTTAVAEPPVETLPTEAVEAAPADSVPPDPTAGKHLTALFDRVNQLLGTNPGQAEVQQYLPPEPPTLPDTNLTAEDVEKLILKFLLARGSARSAIAQQVCTVRPDRPA